jgi:AcrR family transcriptional regulator
MTSKVASAIAELEPEGLGPEGPNWQQRKSSETRVAILDAAIDCLAQHGYSRTTTQLIARMAKVSRGAMLHHYATKQELIAAVIEYAFYKHMEAFCRAIRALTEQERVEKNAGISVEWRICASREYKAYVELNVAARTDVELRKLFLPRARRHDQVWRAELMDVFPEWRHDPAKQEFVSRFVRSAIEGLALNRAIWDDPAMETALLDFIATTVVMVRDNRLPYPALKTPPASAV